MASLTSLAKPEATEESVRGLLLKVAGAIGTGIGVVGFVTFSGGALVWLRAKEAGIPADEAVAVVPKSVLVSMGASYLVPALLIALLALACLGAIHAAMFAPAQYRAKGLRDQAKKLRFKAETAIRNAEPAEKEAVTARELATKLNENFEQAKTQDSAAGAVLRSVEAAAVQQQRVAHEREDAAVHARASAEKADSEALKAEAILETALAETPERERVQRYIEGSVSFVILAVVPLVLASPDLGELGNFSLLLLVVVAVGAAGTSFAAYVYKEKFVWFGLAAFAGVALYVGCATYLRTTIAPKVEPVAVLREGHEPFTGLFVADTESSVYVGTFNEPGDPSHLRVIPRSQVTDVTVGPLLGFGEARREAVQLAVHECEEVVEVKSGHGTSAACSKKQQQALEQRLKS